jgi:hypothetical protein
MFDFIGFSRFCQGMSDTEAEVPVNLIIHVHNKLSVFRCYFQPVPTERCRSGAGIVGSISIEL